MSNAPTWSRDVTKLLNPQSDNDWRLLASRLGYSNDDIRAWATQSDPCMALLSEWYATHKTREATGGVLNSLQEINRLDAAVIVENAMKVAGKECFETLLDWLKFCFSLVHCVEKNIFAINSLYQLVIYASIVCI